MLYADATYFLCRNKSYSPKAGQVALYRCINQRKRSSNNNKTCDGKLRFFIIDVDGVLKVDLENLVQFYPHDKHCEFYHTNDQLKQLIKPTNKLAKIKGRPWSIKKKNDESNLNTEDQNNNTVKKPVKQPVSYRIVEDPAEDFQLQDEILSTGTGSEYEPSDDGSDEDYESEASTVSSKNSKNSDTKSDQSDDFVYDTDDEAPSKDPKCVGQTARKAQSSKDHLDRTEDKLVEDDPQSHENVVRKVAKPVSSAIHSSIDPSVNSSVDRAANKTKSSERHPPPDQIDRTREPKRLKREPSAIGKSSILDDRYKDCWSDENADEDWPEPGLTNESTPTVYDEPERVNELERTGQPERTDQIVANLRADEAVHDQLIERCLENLKTLEDCSADLSSHLALMKRSYRTDRNQCEFICDS